MSSMLRQQTHFFAILKANRITKMYFSAAWATSIMLTDDSERKKELNLDFALSALSARLIFILKRLILIDA